MLGHESATLLLFELLGDNLFLKVLFEASLTSLLVSNFQFIDHLLADLVLD